MTLLYGKAANGNYYPVQVSEDGQIISVLGQGSLIQPDATAEFKNVILDNPNNADQPGLGYVASGTFVPVLGSANFDGANFQQANVTWIARTGTYRVLNDTIQYWLELAFSSATGLPGSHLAITGFPLPLGASYGVGSFVTTWTFWEGLTRNGNSPLNMLGYFYVLSPGGAVFVPAYADPISGFPASFPVVGLTNFPAYLYLLITVRFTGSTPALAASPELRTAKR
jgi:hypothetical protein